MRALCLFLCPLAFAACDSGGPADAGMDLSVADARLPDLAVHDAAARDLAVADLSPADAGAIHELWEGFCPAGLSNNRCYAPHPPSTGY